MYKIKLLIGKEVIEIKVEARYCFVDGNNNLILQDKSAPLAQPVAMFSASRWIAARKEEE